MSARRSAVRKMVLAVASLSITGIASATTYVDQVGTDHWGGPEVDLSNVVVTSDASNLYVTINMNPSANLTANPYGSYEMGIQVGNGTGGQTAINNNYNLGDPTAGNPYGSTVGISTGENFFIGSELPGGSNSTGGATLYGYSTSGGWSNLYSTYSDPTRFSATATSLSYDFPLTAFGFTAGNTFNFDVWTTFTNPGGQSAYDALDNTLSPVSAPYTSPSSPYDSATVAGSTLSGYTIGSSPSFCTWITNGGGSWTDSTNWNATGGVPTGTASTATFGSTSSAAVVTLPATQTVGQITFSNASQYQITAAPGIGLIMDDTGEAAGPLIYATLGNPIIAVPIQLGGSHGFMLNASANASLTISGNISNYAPTWTGGMVTIWGAGTVTLSGMNTYTGNTTVYSGTTLNIGSATSAGALPITTFLASNGTTNFVANPGTGILAQTLAGLTLGSSGHVIVANPINGESSRTVLSTGSLTITSGGNIDLGANDMIVHSGANGEAVFGPVSTAGTIENEVAAARGTNGAWTGSGITSSAAKASPSNTALAVVLNDTNQSGTLSGTQLVTANPLFNGGLSTFDGQTIADGDVLVKYTYYGDALLTGSVTAGDYAQIDNAFSYNRTNPSTPLTGWYNGDFNYDGVINGDDYTLIDNAFNSQGSVSFAGTSAGPAEMIAADTEQVAGPSSSAVPEPAALGFGGIAAAQLLLRRRRRI